MNIVILAAGKGKRMNSDLPKVLHPLAGKPLLGHVIDAANSLRPRKLVVVHGHGGEKVQAAFKSAPAGSAPTERPTADAGPSIDWALQSPQRGTGHAVAQAVRFLDDADPTLILYADVPLVSRATLQRLADRAQEGKGIALLTQVMPDPSGYGRIVRKDGQVVKIVEQKDADEDTLRIQEINTGILVAPTLQLKAWLAGLKTDNAQGEYYLTDIVSAAVRDGVAVNAVHPKALWEILGVNSKTQLAELERQHQRNLALQLTESGVTLADPARIDIRGSLRCGRDVSIDVGCVFEGQVTLGDRVRIGANCVIRESGIDDDAEILAMSHIDGARVGVRSRVGPFARLRPGTDLGEDNHVGNFVEFKNARMSAGSKANHLAYVGDAEVGARVNIGAGTITCNYDGANKHKTIIEDDVFIGSDSQLVAPVTVRRGATLGAGTTLTREAAPDALTISRTRQTSIPGWKRPVKKKQEESVPTRQEKPSQADP